ncbi:HD domain-containing protein [Halomarina oriensis]|uniref:HD domain-containing protein n=1 Tax=Halomarina oriensis TaxID=671145 RepID=A0A6B0GPK8_9EURY|nr:HD domain-containing protein [Halomarina oriensis]MWG35941.1 HD domain-containing protein [Halomarina oriensis]
MSDTDDDHERSVRDAFPELDRIADDDLRAGVVRAWATAMADNDVVDLATVPWFPPVQRELGIDDEYLVDHVRDVTAGAIALAETLTERRSPDLSLDLVVAGALVHDVSKLYEYHGDEETAVGDLLGHPHFGVHVVAAAGLPVELQHVVLSHTSRTSVDPATLEAEVVRRADEVAASAIRLRVLDDLRDA